MTSSNSPPGRWTTKEWDDFAKRSYYIQGDFKSTETFKHLAAKIADAQKTWNLPGNVLFYLAVSPTFSPRSSSNSTLWALPAETGRTPGDGSSSRSRSAAISPAPGLESAI